MLEEFKNRIEAELAGNVVKVLKDGNMEESIKYVEMFKKIDRVSQMKSYFGTLQQENYMRSWVEISSSVENSENPRFLFDFYESLLSTWNKQLTWYRDVFGIDGVAETVQVFSDTLSSMMPSRENVISSYLKRINEKMELLQEITQSNQFFATELRKKINESNVKISKERMTSLSSGIFNYFNIFIVHYSTLEQTDIDLKFDSIKIMQTNAGDTVRSLENSTPKVFEWIDKAIDRQGLITQGIMFFLQNRRYTTITYKFNIFFSQIAQLYHLFISSIPS